MGENIAQQAGAELGQAQLKLEFYLTLIFCRFGFSGIRFIDLVCYKFDSIDLVWYIGFGKLGSVVS